MNLTDAIKEAYAFAPADVIYYDTLEIDCASFANPIRIVNSHASIVRNEGTFLPVLFDFKPPETAGSVRGEMIITVNGLPREIRAAIRNSVSTRDAVTVLYRQYINADMSPAAVLPVPMSIAKINESHVGIELKALMPDLIGAYFPRKLMTAKSMPGLKL